jgi:hypothetical protein
MAYGIMMVKVEGEINCQKSANAFSIRTARDGQKRNRRRNRGATVTAQREAWVCLTCQKEKCTGARKCFENEQRTREG